MLHVRVISPGDRTEQVVRILTSDLGITNVIVLPGAAREPVGDVILCDVAREAANDLLEQLCALGLDVDGSIAVERVDVSLSEAAEEAKEEAPGDSEDAVVWEEFAQRTREESRLTWAFLVFLTLATQLAGIAVLTDSPILIVGAMVLGPEFAAVAAICFGLIQRDGRLVAVATRTLVAGFTVAILLTFSCALVAYGLGWIEPEMLAAEDRQTAFIVKPDKWAFIVALLAGVAGVLSITAGKSTALVGVFISVTTVPAAGNVAVALALASWGNVAGSLIQLSINVLGMVIAGILTLLVQRAIWRRTSRLRPPVGRLPDEAAPDSSPGRR
ncbi:DUF389 domain-containing protein [Rhizohabitans arisaemae]|uniref:DUF389 domain-containing protein n=1 Tax=Rhizohabitans arisaemae TaxID=2720610 RepID=UPI0024B21E77|nr:DUF389 domain-containing protein [Rhizohabitans arisaemae]